MLNLMEKRNIVIKDRDFALCALKNFSYYGLVNGYKNTFLRIPGSDNFIIGTTFEEIYTLHMLDTSLNNIIFKYVIYLEKALKSRLSYLVSENYGVFTDWRDISCKNVDDYLYYNNYSNSNKQRIFTLHKLKECIKLSKGNPSIIHYKYHKNHIPPWILTTNISYDTAIKWYRILKNSDKISICSSFIDFSNYSLSPVNAKEFFIKALELTKEYRNRIAHGNRTFSILNLPQLPKHQLMKLSFNTVTNQEYNAKLGQNDTFAVILSIIILLDDRFLINNFLKDLNALFSFYKGITLAGKTPLEVFGFPSNFFDRLALLVQKKFS